MKVNSCFQKFKSLVYRPLLHFYFFRKIRIKRNNEILIGKKCKVRFNIYGKNNLIKISPTSVSKKGVITIYGDNTVLEIGDNCYFEDISFWLEDNGSKIIIGNRCHFCGSADISSIEGHKIEIGNDLLASRNLSIVNGDSHSVLGSSGKRINWSKDISIGNHVWIGKNVNILKSGSIGSDVVVGACSLVSKDFSAFNNVVIAGSPAKIVKEDVNWNSKRLRVHNALVNKK